VAAGLTASQVANIAAGFQESVVDVLVKKTVAAAERWQAASIAVVGGVAANSALRSRMAGSTDIPLYTSAPEFSTDNAAMIAAAGYFAPPGPSDADVNPSLSLPSEDAQDAGH
jgi:N6-L-threonylcarbamoyladenine synthase